LEARVQTSRPDDPADASIGDLFHQLVDDGKSFARSEANLYKQISPGTASARPRTGSLRS